MPNYTNISLANLTAFANEIKAKYARQSALEALQERVNGLEVTGGQANVLEGVKVNGTALAIAEKMVDILVATGSENGTISVNGANIAVAGLQALAFKAQVSEADLDAALKAVLDAKASGADLTALAGRVTTAEGAITTLNGGADVDGSVDNKIAAAVAAIMENPDETMNSIKELVDWCNDHAADALELNNQVSTNKQDIADLEAFVGALPEGATSTTVVGYIAEAIAAIGIGDYAKTSEVNAAIAEALKAYYTKSEIDTKFSGYYTKAETDAAIKVTDDKLAGYYTKAETDAAIKVTDDKLVDYVKHSEMVAVTDEQVVALLAD